MICQDQHRAKARDCIKVAHRAPHSEIHLRMEIGKIEGYTPKENLKRKY
jgi:hypothetical protein